MRAAVVALASFAAIGCSRVQEAEVQAKATRVAADHLAEVRALALFVEPSCGTISGTSLAAGTPADHDREVLEVTTHCTMAGVTINGAPMRVDSPPLRGAKAPPAGGQTWEIGVGKSAGLVGTSTTLEEYARIPSSLAADATDLCIKHKANGFELCVAYKNR